MCTLCGRASLTCLLRVRSLPLAFYEVALGPLPGTILKHSQEERMTSREHHKQLHSSGSRMLPSSFSTSSISSLSSTISSGSTSSMSASAATSKFVDSEEAKNFPSKSAIAATERILRGRNGEDFMKKCVPSLQTICQAQLAHKVCT